MKDKTQQSNEGLSISEFMDMISSDKVLLDYQSLAVLMADLNKIFTSTLLTHLGGDEPQGAVKKCIDDFNKDALSSGIMLEKESFDNIPDHAKMMILLKFGSLINHLLLQRDMLRVSTIHFLNAFVPLFEGKPMSGSDALDKVIELKDIFEKIQTGAPAMVAREVIMEKGGVPEDMANALTIANESTDFYLQKIANNSK